MNAIRSVDRFNNIDERAGRISGQLTALCDLYSFLSQIMPSFDGEFERFYPSVVATAGRDISPGEFFETDEQFFVKGEQLLVKGGCAPRSRARLTPVVAPAIANAGSRALRFRRHFTVVDP
jgi:hypothetical protein